jgi:hypothetical protein
MKKAFTEDAVMKQEQPEEKSCDSSDRDSSEEAARKNRQSCISSATINAI